jgi:hypothetical protein
MIEEDYLSVWKLKNEISLNKSYNLIDVFTWALSNTHTLSQAIIYYTLIGDYNNKTFFQCEVLIILIPVNIYQNQYQNQY